MPSPKPIKSAIEPTDAGFVEVTEQRLNNPVGNRQRPSIAHDQARHSNRSIDRTPAVTTYVKRDEQVARKRRASDLTRLPCMAHAHFDERQEDSKILSL